MTSESQSQPNPPTPPPPSRTTTSTGQTPASPSVMLDPPPPPPSYSPPESRLRKTPSAGGDLARALEPILRDCCCGRLDDIQWFNSPWQAGGASTAMAVFTDDNNTKHPAIIKLPVGPDEYRWTVGIGTNSAQNSTPQPTPKVFAGGLSLGSYDLAWLVTEKVPGPALTTSWAEPSVRALLEAVADWYDHANTRWPTLAAPRPVPDWVAWIDRARESARVNAMPDAQRWNSALKKLGKLAPALVDRWAARPVNTWCHGDLHPGNALWRDDETQTPRRAVLIDLALVHASNWVEDAAYFDHLFWGREARLYGIDPVHHLAKLRRDRNLPVDSGDEGLANIKRAVLAAVSPLTLAQDGDPVYVAGALTTLERLLPTLGREGPTLL